MATQARRNDTSRGGWVRVAAAEAQALSAESKQALKAQVDQIIEQHMKPSTLTRRGRRAGFGDVQELYTKWHGRHLVLFAKRRGGRVVDRQVEDFETKSGRLTLVGSGLFEVAYFRHTGRWWTIQSACPLKTALEYFRKPSLLWPW